jgi:hypothetical protein
VAQDNVNWDAIGAVGEVVGGLAVVLSLVYVAFQIRQNSSQIELSSRNIEASMYHQSGDAFSRWWGLLAQDKDLVDIWLRGLAGEDLPPNESLRFQFLMAILLAAWENAYHQVQIGAVQRDTFGFNRESLIRVLQSTGGSRYWQKSAPHTLTPEFRSAVDSILRQ